MFRTRFGQSLARASARGDLDAAVRASDDLRFVATIPDAHTGVDAAWDTDPRARVVCTRHADWGRRGTHDRLWRRGPHGGFRRDWNRYFLANAENIGAGEFGRD